jgi:hypothetical protein
LACTLAGKSAATEAELRTAVGRAYYGVFLEAREVLATTGEISPTWSFEDHRLVVEALRDRGGPEGNQLHKLRAARNKDDYDIIRQRTHGQADRMIAMALSVWDHL